MPKEKIDYKIYIWIAVVVILPAIAFYSKVQAFGEATPIIYKNEKEIIELKTYQAVMKEDITEIKSGIKEVLKEMKK